MDITYYIQYHMNSFRPVSLLKWPLIIISVLFLFSGLFWFVQVQYFTGRAQVVVDAYSKDNSYVFVSPLQASAADGERIRLTVILLNNQGLGVVGKMVRLENIGGLEINEVQPVTDTRGKAIFDISSKVPGEYYPSVIADNGQLPQKPKISFK